MNATLRPLISVGPAWIGPAALAVAGLMAPLAMVDYQLIFVAEILIWGLFALSFGLAWAVISGLFSFFGLYVNRIGLGAGTAALVISLLSMSAIPGKLIFGAAAERIDPRKLVLLGFALQLSFIAVLRSHPSEGLLIGSSIAFGVSLGGLLPIHGALVAGYYGRSSFASVMGAMGPVMTPLMFLAVALGSWLPRVTGGYDRMFEVFLVAQVAAILALGLLHPLRKD